MIGKDRQERLWNHLMELEKRTGRPLRAIPRSPEVDKCPIVQFAPEVDKDGYTYSHATFYSLSPTNTKRYEIYTFEDTHWWIYLGRKTKRETINWLKSKIKEHLK